MTSLGDLCLCGDLASPGKDWCAGCLEDARVARAELVAELKLQTAEHEASVLAADEVVVP